MTLLERSRQMEELHRLAAEAASGRGRLVLVEGEAGVGKTALVRQFTRALPGERRACCGARCDPCRCRVRSARWSTWRPRWAAAFERLLRAEAPRARSFRGAARRARRVHARPRVRGRPLGGRRHPGPPALPGRRLDTTRSLVVATYRDDEVGPRHPLRVGAGRPGDVRAPCAGLTLEPLTPEAVATLAAGSGLDAGELHRRTGGNPFFVTEVLAAGGDVAAADAARRRARPGRALCRAGPACPRSRGRARPRLRPALLAEVGVDDAALEECLASGVLTRDGGAGRLPARAVARRDPGRDAAGPRRRTARAGALGRAAAVSHGPDEFATLAHHAEAAGDGEAVLEFAPRAPPGGPPSCASHREAAAQYARALRWPDAPAAGGAGARSTSSGPTSAT